MKDFFRWIVLSGIFLLPLLPLLVTNSMFFPYITGKNFSFRIIVEIIVAAWVVLALLDQRYRPRFSLILSSFSLFVGIVLIANVFGEAPAKSFWSNFERMEGFVTLLHVFLYFIVSSATLTSERLWRIFFNTSLAAATIVIIYAFIQMIGGGSAYSGNRIDATLGNAIYMAVYMFFHVGIALLMFVKHKEVWLRVLYGTLASLFAFFLFQTETRGTFLGLVAGILAALLYAGIMSRHNKVIRRFAVGGMLSVFLLGGLLFIFRDSSFVEDSSSLRRITSISLSEGETRFTIWSIALEGARERPLLGWGQENFNYVFNTHYRSSLYAQEQWFDRVHNVFLDWLVASGILGFLAYLALFGSAVYLLVARPFIRKENGGAVCERAVLLGILSGYAVHAIFVFDNLISYLFFATILSYVHAKSTTEVSPFIKTNFNKIYVLYGAAPLLGVILIFSIYFINVPHIQAARNLIVAMNYASVSGGNLEKESDRNAFAARGLEEFTNTLSYDAFAQQEVREQLALFAQRVYTDDRILEDIRMAYVSSAEKELLKQIEERPGDARQHVFLGSLYRIAGRYDDALAQFKRARVLSPDKPQIFLDLGLVYLEGGVPKSAEALFLEVLKDIPAHTLAREYAMLAAIHDKDNTLLNELTPPPYDVLYQKSDLVLQTYYRLGMYAEVFSILDARIEDNVSDVQPRITKASLQYELGDIVSSIQTVREAMIAIPSFRMEGERIISDLSVAE